MDPASPKQEPAAPPDATEVSASASSSEAVSPSSAAAPSPAPAAQAANSRPRNGLVPNNVRKLRQAAMMSKAELARRAGVSHLTINRVEAGRPCRMDTKRKILEALGLKPDARKDVFPDLAHD